MFAKEDKIRKLRFSDNLEKEFREKYYLSTIPQVRLAFLSVIVIYSIFAWVDHLLVPEYSKDFMVVRFGIVIPFFLFSLIISYTKLYSKITNLILSFNVLIAGLSILFFLFKSPTNYTYYNAILIVLSAGYFMVRMRFIYSAVTGIIILLAFNIVFIGYKLIDFNELISLNLLYLVGNFMGIFANYFFEYYSRLNFYQSRQIKNNEILYSSTFSQTTIAILHLSENLEIIRANNSFFKIFKHNTLSWNEVKRFFNLNISENDFRNLKSGIINEIESRFEIKEENETKIFNVVISLVRDEDGSYMFYTLFIYDITKIKRIEEDLRLQLNRIKLSNKTMIDREFRIIEMKKEVNELCRKLNIPEKYDKIWVE